MQIYNSTTMLPIWSTKKLFSKNITSSHKTSCRCILLTWVLWICSQIHNLRF